MSHKRGSQGSHDSPIETEKASSTIPAADTVNHTHHDPNWDRTGVDFSHVNEAKVLRKMDLHILPMLALLYLLSFLDRGNIGDAKIEGLTD